MSEIKERFFYCLIGTVTCFVVTLWFVYSATWHIVIMFAAATTSLMLLTIRMSGNYQSARLISENPILNIGMASVLKSGDSTTENRVIVVVSGFGILVDGKPYKFGHGGVNLTTATICRESITLSFGDNEKAYSVRLLHGISNRTEVEKFTERLRYETGVVADVSGW